jgi:hypothetical protein
MGKKGKKCVGCAVGKRGCIPMQRVYIARSVRVGHFLSILAFLALLKRIFLPILAGMEVKRTEKITFRCTVLEKAALAEQALRCGLTTSEYCRSLSLGGQPKERYSEEEKALLRDIAKIRGDLQRLNNYFGGRQYREVFEENRVIIEKLKKLLR